MRLVVQRVSSASVEVDGNITGKIDKGFFVLVGVEEADDEKIADKMVSKLIGLRIRPIWLFRMLEVICFSYHSLLYMRIAEREIVQALSDQEAQNMQRNCMII